MEDRSIADNWADALDAIMDSSMDDHPAAGEGDWADALDAIPDDVESHSPVDDHSSAGDGGWADALDAISEGSLCLSSLAASPPQEQEDLDRSDEEQYAMIPIDEDHTK